jgi:hypothetical protein
MAHQVFFDVENRGAEIDEQASLYASGSEIPEQLGHMFVHDVSDGLQLHNELAVDEEIGGKLAQQGAVLIKNIQWVLLDDLHALLSQSVRQGVLVDLLEMPVPVVAMDGETRFAD